MLKSSRKLKNSAKLEKPKMPDKILGIDTKVLIAWATLIPIIFLGYGVITHYFVGDKIADLKLQDAKAQECLKYHHEAIDKKADKEKVDVQFQAFSKQIESFQTAIGKLNDTISVLSENTAVLNSEMQNIKRATRQGRSNVKDSDN